MANSVGGVLAGMNPFIWESSNPITLFLFQLCLIMLLCNIVHFFFAKIRQPKVISEVIAGVILGPTVFGQIPNYTETVFPTASLPMLNLMGTLGIILFMFFLGLEVDIAFIKKHLRTAFSIGICTLAFPFGCGCLLAIPLYNNYANKDPNSKFVKFTVYMVFIAVSISVTAFPVLCRILNELRLIKDRAGIVVLGGGLINDILGWILLALSVILSNASSDPMNTLYILLCVFGWFLLYFYPVRYFVKWILVKTHELDRNKPSPLATMFVLFLMFISAYFTDIIGVHSIFGAFIAGLVVPRDNHYEIKLVERMEDIPNILLIPIYFAVAGLNVDLTLLNQGKDWGFVFASIGIAIFSKIFSGTLVSKINGLFWRESMAVGVLMSCKGIVEIVVLTVGLNAGIISEKIYGMFILMALASTFVTTPLTILCYPESYRKKIQSTLEKKDEENDGVSLEKDTSENTIEFSSLKNFKDFKTYRITEFINIINTPDEVSTSLELLNHLNLGYQTPEIFRRNNNNTRRSFTSYKKSSLKLRKMVKKFSTQTDENCYDEETIFSDIEEIPSGIDSVIALKSIHLRHLTERTTDLIQSSTLHIDEPNFTANSDSLLQIFYYFSRLGKVPFSSEVIFSTNREKVSNLEAIKRFPTDLLFLPLNGSSYQSKRSHALIDDKYRSFDQIFSHLLGINELPSNFFSQLSEINSNILLLISNNSDRLNVDRFKKKTFHLLLPNPNFTSSDLLALYLLFLISYRSQKSGYFVTIHVSVNEKNLNFMDKLEEEVGDQKFFYESNIDVFPNNTEVKTDQGMTNSTFIRTVLDKHPDSEDSTADLEETTFIIAESYFNNIDPFSEEVKATILEGSNKKFNVMVVHQHQNE